MTTLRHRVSERGFGLIEVMIAVLVIAIGLLGFAKMQALAVGSTRNSGTRAIVAMQTSALAAAMRANEAYWAAGLAPATLTISGSTLGDATLNGLTVNCTTGVCTPAQMAAFDLKNWGTSLTALFPASTGSVACSTVVGSPVTCTITVSWSEKAIAINAATASGAGTGTFNYTLLVQP